MSTRFINQLLLDRILAGEVRPPKTGETYYRVKHCPSLGLRLPATGAAKASWRVMYRVRGKITKEVLGRATALNVAEAVARAEASKAQARQGINPVAARRAVADQAGPAGSVAAAADAWFRDHVERNCKPGTVSGYRQIFDHDILPAWGARPLADITRGDVLELLHDKAGTRQRARRGAQGGAGSQANHCLARLRSFFGWAVANGLLVASPSAGVRRLAREVSRARVLSDDEIKAFWRATGADLDPGAVPWRPLFRMLLLTAARRSEVAFMRWQELDTEARVWQIPAARTKNGKAHTVHLSNLAMEVLAALPRASAFVFSGSRRLPATGFSRAKARLDAAMRVDDWVTHDLRRTATTLMARAGVAPHVADRVLNHTSGTIHGVAAVYNRFAYLDERRAAVETLGRFIAELVGVGESNVVGNTAGLNKPLLKRAALYYNGVAGGPPVN
jgi:integrase